MSILAKYAQRFSLQNVPLSTFFTNVDILKAPGNIPWMPGVEQTAIRLAEAILRDEKICIYSDYDTDAVTATGVMYWGLLDLGAKPENVTFYAPDRFTEGYGMNTEAVASLAAKNDVIISVDCGINSVQEAEVVKKAGTCDLIITDHHHLHDKLPDALCVVNPRLTAFFADKLLHTNDKNDDKNFVQDLPQKWVFQPHISAGDKIKDAVLFDKNVLQNYLHRWADFAKKTLLDVSTHTSYSVAADTVTGVGVSWLVVLHLGFFLQEMGKISAQNMAKINRTLPLVAIGTIADCQSVKEPLNRIFVKAGLSIAQKNQHQIPGLTALMQQTGLLEKMENGYKLNSQDCAFTFSPILNSSGRLTHAHLSIQTVTAADAAQAKTKASELIQINEERKEYVKSIVNEIDLGAEESLKASDGTMIWLQGNWSKGVIGLVASRLVSRYGVPCVILSTENEEHITASLRAPEGFHLPNAMQFAGEDLFEKFGGHPGAAGFSSSYQTIDEIKQKMLQAFIHQQASYTAPQFQLYPDNWAHSIPPQLDFAKYKQEIIWIDSAEISTNLLQSLWQLDPFGIDFPLPQFAFCLNNGSFRWLGQDFKHLKITLPSKLTVTIFNIDDETRQFFVQLPSFQFSKPVWIVAKPSQNTWNGATNFELIAEQIVV